MPCHSPRASEIILAFAACSHQTWGTLGSLSEIYVVIRRARPGQSKFSVVFSITCCLSSSLLPTRGNACAMRNRSCMSIALEGETELQGCSKAVFSTSSIISGHVLVRMGRDTPFDEFSISFLGCSRTYIEGLGARSMEATHDYLTQESPIEDTLLPSPRVFHADRTYRIPFTFVIPSRLLPHACQDRVIEQAHALHLQLPPSMNDTCTSNNSTGLDGFTPKMAKISYSVKVRVARREKEHGITIIAETERCVHVRPEGEEHPPVFVGPDDKDYRLSQAKTIRKALIGGALGRLAIDSYQPSPVFAGIQRNGGDNPKPSFATIRVRFDPARAGIQPPRLESLRVALKATTFFSAKPWKHIPSLEQAPLNFNPRYFSKGLALGSQALGQIKWEKQVIGNDSSGASSSQCSLEDFDPSYAPLPTDVPPIHHYGGISYTTQFSVPIQIPTRSLVPTFHSCLVSRVYTLELTLVTNTSTSLSLKVPLQII